MSNAAPWVAIVGGATALALLTWALIPKDSDPSWWRAFRLPIAVMVGGACLILIGVAVAMLVGA